MRESWRTEASLDRVNRYTSAEGLWQALKHRTPFFVMVLTSLLSGCDSSGESLVKTLDVVAAGIPEGSRVRIGVSEAAYVDVFEGGVRDRALTFDARANELIVLQSPPLNRCEIEARSQRRDRGLLKIVCTSRIPQFQPIVSLLSDSRGEMQDISWIGAVGDVALFVLEDRSRNGSDLWRSDGTVPGTFALTRSAPGERVSSLGISLGGYVLIWRHSIDDVPRTSLWRTDGSSAGTYEIYDLGPLSEASVIDAIRFGNGALWVERTNGNGVDNLQYFDGNVVTRIASVREVDRLFPVAENSAVILLTEDAGGKIAWKRMDAATQVLRDITDFEDWFGDRFILGPSNGRHLFVNVWSRNELWISDGRPEGTRRIASDAFVLKVDTPRGVGMKPEAKDSHFVASGSDARRLEFFKTDGSENGTSRFSQVSVYSVSDRPALFHVNGGVYFSGSDGAAFSPFVYRNGGLRKILQFDSSAPIDNFVSAAGLTYFSATDAKHGTDRLWITDDSEAGTRGIAEEFAFVRSLLATDQAVFAVASDSGGRKVWAGIVPE